MELTEQELSGVIRSNPGDIAIYQLEGGALHTLYLAPTMPALCGMTAEEYRALTGQDAVCGVLKSDRAHIAELLEQMRLDGQDVDCTYRIVHKERGFLWIHARARMLGTHSGCPVLLVVFFNVSGEAESLLDHSNGSVYVLDRHTHELLYANGPALRAWGKSDFTGRACYDFICGRSEPCPWCSIPQMKNGSVHVDEAYTPNFDLWFRVDCHELKWYGRDAVAVYSFDITDQKRQQQNLEKIILNVPVGVGVCQFHGSEILTVAVNPCIRELLALSGQDFSTAKEEFLPRIHPEDRAAMLEEMSHLSQPGLSVQRVFRYYPEENGNCCWYQFDARTVEHTDGVMAFICLSDISAEKEAEASELKSRRMYESAVAAAQLAVWEYDIRAHRISTLDGVAQHGSPLLCEMGGAPDSMVEWVEKKDVDRFLALYRALDAGAPSASCEVWFRFQSNAEPFCERITYTTVFDEDGKPVKAYGIGQDITAQKLEERKYDQMYLNLIESNPNSLGTFRQNITKNWCGDGQSPFPELLAAQDAGTVDGYVAALAATVADDAAREEFSRRFSRDRLLDGFHSGRSQFSMEVPIRLSDGDLRWVTCYFNLFQNPASGEVEAVSYSLDNTEQRKDLEIVRRITDENCDYIGLIDVKDQTFQFRNVNRQIEGLPPKRKVDYTACVDYDLSHYVAEDDKVLFLHNTDIDHLTSRLFGGLDYAFTYSHCEGNLVLRKQLQYSWLDAEEREILVIQTDITAVYAQEQEQFRRMEEAVRSAESANQAKSEFLSRISHDIRTPMNVISGMTIFALEDIDDREKLKEDLHQIQVSNTFLLSLINDILDISKIDGGQIELHPEPYPYAEYIADIRSMFEPLCRQKGIRFAVEEKCIEGTIVADRIRINQIALNLLTNAVKYTQEGGTVSCITSIKALPSGALDCTIEVRDTGVGMSQEFQAKMFEPFTQEFPNEIRSLQERGTGLGLSIVKRIVELMGGNISVESAQGAGTDIRVQFVFPDATPEQLQHEHLRSRPAPSEDAETGGVILLAEDHPINAAIAQRLLDSFGYGSVVAEDGAKTVELFRSSAPGYYRAILMDIQMPVMNGYEATEAIRKLDRPDAESIPIIAMTADAYAEDVDHCLRSGMNGHVAKPLDPTILHQTLTRFL